MVCSAPCPSAGSRLGALIPIAQISLVSLAAFLAKGGIFFDFIERAFAHAAFTIPLRREMLVILSQGVDVSRYSKGL